jgi:hypothetical protein
MSDNDDAMSLTVLDAAKDVRSARHDFADAAHEYLHAGWRLVDALRDLAAALDADADARTFFAEVATPDELRTDADNFLAVTQREHLRGAGAWPRVSHCLLEMTFHAISHSTYRSVQFFGADKTE